MMCIFKVQINSCYAFLVQVHGDYSKEDIGAKVERPAEDTSMEGEQQQEVVGINQFSASEHALFVEELGQTICNPIDMVSSLSQILSLVDGYVLTKYPRTCLLFQYCLLHDIFEAVKAISHALPILFGI